MDYNDLKITTTEAASLLNTTIWLTQKIMGDNNGRQYNKWRKYRLGDVLKVKESIEKLQVVEEEFSK